MCWKSWLEELPRLEQFSIDRCFKPPNFGDIISCQLHHFSDASQVAYGAVSYLRLVNAQHEVHCSFVMGKSQLSPLKPVTIPRMELSAAVLSTRLDRMIRQVVELPINDSFYWTDSTCVLRNIANSERRYKTFAANQVAAIQSNPTQVNGITLEQRRTLLTMPQGAYLPRLSSEVTARQRVQNSFGCPKKIGPMCLLQSARRSNTNL